MKIDRKSAEKAQRHQRIFLSFSGLLQLLHEGEITERDLEGAQLFYFGCTQGYPELRSGTEVEWYEEEGPVLQAVIVRALEIAESEGRTAWRTVGNVCTYAQLNELLVRHGLPTVVPKKKQPDWDFLAIMEYGDGYDKEEVRRQLSDVIHVVF